MPYLSEEELKVHNDTILHLEEDQIKSTQINNDFIEAEKRTTKKFKVISIILGFLVLCLGGYSLYNASKTDRISLIEHNQKISILKDRLHQLDSINQAQNLTINNLHNIPKESSLDNVEVYTVQVGAFKNKDLGLYSENFVNFKEIKNDDLNKYALGNFESLVEAEKFREELITLGLTDAFVCSYINGERIYLEKTH